MLFVIIYCINRTGEVQHASLKASIWSKTEEALNFGWSMLKTCKQKYMTINPDSGCYLLCFYWTYAVYLIIGSLSRYSDNNPEGDYALFPSFWNKNPVKKMNDGLKVMFGDGYTGTGIHRVTRIINNNSTINTNLLCD